jgi:hypothetical protein
MAEKPDFIILQRKGCALVGIRPGNRVHEPQRSRLSATALAVLSKAAKTYFAFKHFNTYFDHFDTPGKPPKHIFLTKKQPITILLHIK